MEAESRCIHPYVVGKGPVKFCLECKRYVGPEKQKEEKAEIIELVMPPLIYTIDERLWKSISPWPRIGLDLVKKYGWYVSVVGMDEYLVMPITRKKQTVFYSARRLTDNGGPKYHYPKGVIKHLFKSAERLGNVVALCEGYADAAYSGQIVSSVALLGSYYYDELAEWLQHKIVLTLLDGDHRGLAATFKLTKALQQAVMCETKIVQLPKDADPTDLPLSELRLLIKKQTGVRL